jgi:hypothetical protein
VGVDRATAHQRFAELKIAEGFEQTPRRADDLGPDPVAGQ